MQFSDVITAVRAITGHDTDTQFSDSTQLLPVLTQEYRRLRRWLCVHVPTLCEMTGSAVVTTVGTTSTVTMTIDGVAGSPVSMTAINLIPKSIMTNFERLRKVERNLGGSSLFPLRVFDDLNYSRSCEPCVHEQPDRLVIYPTSILPGTFQLTWVAGSPASLTSSSTIVLPEGLEDVLTYAGAEFVSARHDPDRIKYFADKKKEILQEQKRDLRKRYGCSGEPGLTIVEH